jgi:hypothetical protein
MLHPIESGFITGRGQPGLQDPSSGFVVVQVASGGFTGLLDTYPGASFAYSFRKLNSAYAGAAIRLREDAGDTEADIGFDVDGAFDTAAAATHIGGSTGHIVTWYDQSGNGNNAAQSTHGEQPLYAAAGLNSLPTMTFTAASQHNLVKAGISCASNAAAAGFAVCDLTSSAESDAGLVSLCGNSDVNGDWYNNTGVVMARSAQQVIVTHAAAGAVKAVTYTVPFRYAWNHTGTGHTVYVDTAASSTTSNSTMTLGTSSLNLVIGGRMPGEDLNWDGHCSEIIFYLSNQAANLAGIDADQVTAWGF